MFGEKLADQNRGRRGESSLLPELIAGRFALGEPLTRLPNETILTATDFEALEASVHFCFLCRSSRYAVPESLVKAVFALLNSKRIPGITLPLKVGSYNGQPFAVYPAPKGVPLSEFASNPRYAALQEECALRVLEVLDRAQQAGICIRGITPAHVYVASCDDSIIGISIYGFQHAALNEAAEQPPSKPSVAEQIPQFTAVQDPSTPAPPDEPSAPDAEPASSEKPSVSIVERQPGTDFRDWLRSYLMQGLCALKQIGSNVKRRPLPVLWKLRCYFGTVLLVTSGCIYSLLQLV